MMDLSRRRNLKSEIYSNILMSSSERKNMTFNSTLNFIYKLGLNIMLDVLNQYL